MLHKIKIFSLVSLLALSCQTTLFAMNHTFKTLKDILEYTQEIKDLESGQNILCNMLQHLISLDSKDIVISESEIINGVYIDKADIILIKKRFGELSILYTNEQDKAKYLKNINDSFFDQLVQSLRKPINKNHMHDLKNYVNKVFTQNTIIHNNQQPNTDPNPQENINQEPQYSHHPLNILALFKEKFNSRYKDPVKIEFIAKCKSLKEKSKNKEVISQDDIKEVQNLWDQYKLFYNYNLVDSIVYPLHEFIDEDTLRDRCKKKDITRFIHSDKYRNDPDNYEKIEELFKYLTNPSRPTKSLDFIVNNRIVTNVAFHTSAQLLMTACTLPSFLFPNYFKSKNASEYEHATKRIMTDIKEQDYTIKHYNNVIKNRDNTTKHRDNNIKQYSNAIRRTELNISRKQEIAKKALKIFSEKNIIN